MEGQDKNYLVALSYFPKFGPVRLRKLKNHFSSWMAAFAAPVGELICAGIEEKLAKEFSQAKKEINPEAIAENLQKENIKTISIEENTYPKLLKQIFYPPFLLYYKGNLNFDGQKALAVVGARKCTYYGQQVIEKIIPPLIKNKITIVSGLAIGIDSLASTETVKVGGSTITILGSGIDRKSIYPEQNLRLAEHIIESGGAIVSEFPPETPPLKQHFPQRNRIIAGLTKATLVIEAAEKSGSLITARYALDEGREVLAVPGNIFSPTSAGPNSLIRSGAKPIIDANDILESFGLGVDEKNEKKDRDFSNFSLEEQKILEKLSQEPKHVDELIREAKLDTKIINSILSILEIKNAVRNVGGGSYIIL
jgi:DNA processing protein